MNVSQISGPGPPQLQSQTQQQSSTSRGPLSDRFITGSSCRALKTAVSALYSVDDFIQEKIGSGFFSEVFKVTHRTTGEVMVLKMNQLRSNRPNMLREVQLLNKFSHPNILRFMGVCVHEGQLHALTEYINGGSLEQLVQNPNEILSPSLKIRLALGIAKGMAYVHDYGVFHRDLTSKNVLIRRSNDNQFDAVVGDFGLAAKIPRKCGNNRLDTVGSPYWMSPECIIGLWYDQTSDVFSYGIILCEIIARIDADPDYLPRTNSFGLDYLAFVDLCPYDTPPAFLRTAFYCCTYDPKSRPTFNEIIKKLTSLYDKISTENNEIKSNHIVINILSNSNSNVSNNNSNNNNQYNNNQIFQNNNNNNNKRNSVDANYLLTSGSSEKENETIIALRSKCEDDSHNDHTPLQHRRSLSENIIFPQHTTPSDKARCHIMNRTNSKTVGLANPDSPTSSNITLRKVAETMFLKDPQYKPRVGDQTKSNPFTALAQLKGVKKLLGANPGTYTTGVGDLFSSCFEMSSPLLRQLSTDKLTINGNGSDVQPKSLPSSPRERRKDYKFDGTNKNQLNKDTSIPSQNGNNENNTYVNNNSNSKFELDVQKSTGTIKKYKVNSLFSHPLFKNGKIEENNKNLSNFLNDKSNSNETVCFDDKNLYLLNRRGSTESGFFSYLNEDFSTYRQPCCCVDRISNQTLNDSNSKIVFDDPLTISSSGGTVSSLRSLDDLELSESRKRCRHHQVLSNIDIDSRSIDLINRLALDSEINNFIQKNQFSNQLLYCKKNRASSIYTDSSDDISSLAGSDSLLWDDRSFTTLPNTRSTSAQIAKIVEYFERQSQAFKQTFTVPENFKSSPNSITPTINQPQSSSSSSTPSSTCSSSYNHHHHHHHHHHRYNNNFPDCFVDYNFSDKTNRKFPEIKNRTSTTTTSLNDYETFCIELDKKSSQQRLMICEGAVRSKLLLFDKLNQANQRE